MHRPLIADNIDVSAMRQNQKRLFCASVRNAWLFRRWGDAAAAPSLA
jgi:hypothetical protein